MSIVRNGSYVAVGPRTMDWVEDRGKLMNKIEASEKRKDAVTAMTTTLSLPREFTDEQNIALVKDFVEKAYLSKGMIVDSSIHKSKARDGGWNPHAHLIMSTRKIEDNGFASKKEESWRGKAQLHRWRKQWADVQNDHLAKNGFNNKVDHRNYKEQGVDKTPTKHEGKIVTALRKRGVTHDREGKTYDRMDDNFFINHKNRVHGAMKIYQPETIRKQLVLSSDKVKDYSPDMQAHMQRVKGIVDNSLFLTEAEQDRQKSSLSVFMQKSAHYARYLGNAIKERLTTEKDRGLDYTR